MYDTLIDHAELPALKRVPPEWARREGFTFIGDWAGPLYGTRRGWPVSPDDGGVQSMDVDPETLARDAARLGCNCVVLSCNLDLSVRTPQDSLEIVKDKIKRVQQHGLRAGVYLRADYVVLEAGDEMERKLARFCQRDQRGLVPTWSVDTDYKKKLCYHHPEVLDHFRERVRFAIQDLGVDFLHIDGYEFGGYEALDACRCDRCRDDFREYLQRRYPDPDGAVERFGHARLDGIEPPTTYPHVTAPDLVRCPVWQEWIRFRCGFAARMGHAIAQATADLDPEVAIEFNVGVCTQENNALIVGQDLPTMGRYSDGIWSEDGYWPNISAEGRIITRIRQMKMVEAAGNHFIAYITSSGPQNERQLRQSIAHMASFNRGALGCVGFAGIMSGGMEYQRNFEPRREMMQWIRARPELYGETEPYGDVAVWRSQGGLAFAPRRSFAAFMRTEQLLIEDRIPFAIIFDDWVKAPHRHRALLLPAVDGLSRDQAERIRAFVRDGGGVLIGQETGQFDLNRRPRTTPLLADLVDESERVDNPFMQLGTYGTGRVARIPDLIGSDPPRPAYRPDGIVDLSLDHSNWVLPAEADQVRAALDWLLGHRRQVVVEAPRGVLAEYRRRGDRLVVHLVNMREQAALNVALRVRIVDGEEPAITVESPDESTSKQVQEVRDGGSVVASLPCLDVYAVVTVSPFVGADDS
ncbi:MAG: hypothetical protein CMJ18_24655 [Phycisphaeraceae bacterium]|nr:hypothetical protein [Phycisphaeraceae bacterium]